MARKCQKPVNGDLQVPVKQVQSKAEDRMDF